jgi:hypothetical protein
VAIRIKVEKIDFDEAEDNGFVYGRDLERPLYDSVYVDLGSEREYIPSHKDNPKTEYRKFVRSYVKYAYSGKDADDGKFVHEVDDTAVIIYM